MARLTIDRGAERGALALLCVLAAALRFFRIDAQSLWYDEGTSAYQLTRTFGGIVRAAAGDTHPPLYYWTLKVWGSVFGWTELGLRSLSAVLGIAAVILTWLVARRLFGPRAAVIAAVLLAVAPLAVYYSQEVRMYTQVLSLGLLAAWAYLARRWLVYALAAAATVYSQYLGLSILAAIHVHALLGWRSTQRRDRVGWALANGAAAVAFLPWLPVFLDQVTHRGLNTSPRTSAGLFGDTLAAYGGGIASGNASLLGGTLIVVLAVGGAAIGLAVRRRQSATLFALLMWLVPLALVIALGFRSGLFERRYLLLSMPGLMMLAGSCLDQAVGAIGNLARHAGSPGWIARAGAVALGGVTLGALVWPASSALLREYFDPALARDDYRGLVRAIQSQSQPSDAIVLSAPNQVETFSFYYHGPLAVYPLPAQRPVDRADTIRRLEGIRQAHDRVWLVSWAMREADPAGVIDEWLARNGFQASHEWYGTLQLMLISLAQPSTFESAGVALDNGIDLDRFSVGSRTIAPGGTVDLTLVWRALATPTERWKVFTQLLDAQQRVVAQRDAEPQAGMRPTSTWQPGEEVEDRYGIVVPESTPPGTYQLITGMYLEQSGRRAVHDGATVITLGAIEVRR